MENWKRIKLDEFTFPEAREYEKEYLNQGSLSENVKLNETRDVNDILIIDELRKGFTGVGREFTNHVISNYNTGLSLYIPKGEIVKDPIKLEFKMDRDNPTIIDQNIIIASPSSRSTIVFDYLSEDDQYNFHNGMTKVYAQENSEVTIVKIQRMNDFSHNFDSNIAYVQRGARVNWVTIEMGSEISGSHYTTILEDEFSQGNLASIYLGDRSRKMDLEYTMVHKGRRSISNIESRGVLMDEATKVFRGNLDFKKGAKLSRGVEEEYVVLLDPAVKSDSIPALLCEEDDVSGEHAASAGQINEDQLFYLMSRGLSLNEAKKLIVTASFRPILDKIPIEDMKNTLIDEVSRRLDND